MTDLTAKYPATPHSTAPLTLGVASLASDPALLAGRASAVVNNTSSLDLDHLVSGAITTGATTAVGTIEVWVYAAHTISGGTPAFPDTVTGSDASVALTSASMKGSALVRAAVISTDITPNRTYYFTPFSVADLFGGSMPPYWGLFIVHNTGVALNATAANHFFSYERVQASGVGASTPLPGTANVSVSRTEAPNIQNVQVSASTAYAPYAGNVARYFPANATPVTVANRGTLQSVLNANKIVRLDAGDYSSVSITMDTGMELYGVLNRKTVMPNITIAPGAHDVVIKGFTGNSYDSRIVFPSSSIRTYNIFVGMINTVSLYGVGSTVERLTMANMEVGYVYFDNTSGGYTRNCRFIRHATTQGGHTGAGVFAGKPCFYLKGNADMSSYGNTLQAAAHLGAYTGQVYVENQVNFGLMNVEVESYSNNVDGLAVQNFINCGTVRFSVGDGKVIDGQRVLDNGATNLVMTDVEQDHSGAVPYTHRANAARSFMFNCQEPTNVTELATTRARFTSNGGSDPIRYNGSTSMNATAIAEATALLRDSGAISRSYALPTERAVPDPAPSNWKTARATAADSRAFLQNLLDNNRGVCYIPPGIYYISSALKWYKDQIIIGAGSDVCAVIAMSDSNNVFESAWGNTQTNQYGTSSLADIAIYGGKDGWAQNETGIQLALFSYSHVVFRDCTNAGFHLDHTSCWDNGFVEYCDFVNCGNAISQTGYIPPNVFGDLPELCYMDKTVFFRCQFINNAVFFDNNAAHVSGAQQFNECYFKNNAKLFYVRKYTTKWCSSNCVFDGNGLNDTSDQRFVYEGCKFIGASGGDAFHRGEATISACTYSTTGTQPIFGQYGNYLAFDCDFGTVPVGSNAAPVPPDPLAPSYSLDAVNSKFASGDAARYQQVISTNNQLQLINVASAPKTKLFREGNGA